MTSQIQDEFIHQDQLYYVIGVNGMGLPSPRDFGMSPISFSSGCIRGYYSEYTCDDQNLVLTAMSLRLKSNHDYKEIDGVHAVGDPKHEFNGKHGMYKYVGLNRSIMYSGGFLIAKDYITAVNIMEFPQSYETVYELLFDQGKLVKSTDCSEIVAQNRDEALRKRKVSPPKIEFSLEFDLLYANHIEEYSK